MAGVARRKARNLEIVMHQFVRFGEWMVFAAEELLLVVVAGTPGEHRADVQFFAEDLAHHVIRLDPLSWILVMRTARGMHVMVAGIPVILGRIDPAVHGEGSLICAIGFNAYLFGFGVILGTHGGRYDVKALGNRDGLTIGTINLRLEEKVGSEAFGGIGIQPTEGILNDESGGGWRALFIPRRHAPGIGGERI